MVAGPAEHRRTDIVFSGDADPYRVIRTLHPTPAVGGLPRQEALELIRELEPHDRMLYSGPVGIVSPNESHVFVNLRCMQVSHGNVHLFAGGGITAGSDPAAEWEETELKLRTLLRFL